jgi:cyclopropane-fatty-acyl-phospholipid synthase
MDRDRHKLLKPGQLDDRSLPAITVTDERDFATRLLRSGPLGFGEAFINESWRGGRGHGDLLTETDEVVDWLVAYVTNLMARERTATVASKLGWRWRLPVSAANSRQGSLRNISLHYDLPTAFFRTFLDDDLVYSCADYRTASSLATAQEAKLRGLLDLAQVGEGSRVLDIGCGWGALVVRAAAERKAVSTGITVSRGQCDHCSKLIEDRGLASTATVLLEDYRDHSGQYDSVMSVEMIEAVGARHWARYFTQIERLLAPGGTAVIQAITFPDDRMKRSLGNYSWVDRYIFPGGELISVEEVERILRRDTSLELTVGIRLSSSYARTLQEWRHRFCSRLEHVRALGFDEKFMRVWALYFAYFEAGFRARYLDVWQLKLSSRVASR